MSKICVYTCITGDYDDLKEIKNVEKNIDYFCFTNNHNIKSKTWNVIYIDNEGVDNHRLARKIKILGHPIIWEYDISVWQDASVTFNKKVNSFISTFFDNEKDNLCVPKHYCRKTVKEEANECIRLKKDSKDLIKKQMLFYKENGFKDDLGLFETTVFIRNNKSKLLNDTLKVWYEMIEKYSKRDQLSLTYAAFKTGLIITPIDIVVWNNKWFDALPHNSYGQTYNVFYSSKDNGVYDILDVYYYKKDKDDFIIDFKNKKSSFKICFADVKSMLCTVVKSNCELSNINSLNVNNTFFNVDSFVCLEGNKKTNGNVKITIRLEKASVSVQNIILELNEELLKKKNYIYNLKNQNNDLRNEIKNIENSSSWKITKPLRTIKKIIRK